MCTAQHGDTKHDPSFRANNAVASRGQTNNCLSHALPTVVIQHRFIVVTITLGVRTRRRMDYRERLRELRGVFDELGEMYRNCKCKFRTYCLHLARWLRLIGGAQAINWRTNSVRDGDRVVSPTHAGGCSRELEICPPLFPTCQEILSNPRAG